MIVAPCPFSISRARSVRKFFFNNVPHYTLGGESPPSVLTPKLLLLLLYYHISPGTSFVSLGISSIIRPFGFLSGIFSFASSSSLLSPSSLSPSPTTIKFFGTFYYNMQIIDHLCNGFYFVFFTPRHHPSLNDEIRILLPF